MQKCVEKGREVVGRGMWFGCGKWRAVAVRAVTRRVEWWWRLAAEGEAGLIGDWSGLI